MIFVLEVPLPPYALSPNHSVGSLGARMAKSVRYAGYRDAVRLAALNEMRRIGWAAPERARISLHFGVRPIKGEARAAPHKLDRLYRPHDWDNAVAAFKAGQDGLVQAGVIAGDDRQHLDGGSVTFDATVGPFVRVTIEPIVAGTTASSSITPVTLHS